jgi:perosamine synthetase
MSDLDGRIGAMSVPVSATVLDAMAAIDRGALGCALLVDDEGRFAGLVTDGDLRRALLRGVGTASPLAAVERPPSRAAGLGTEPTEVAALFSEPVRVVPLLDADGRVADLATFDRRLRIPVAEPLLGERELQYVTECVVTGWISSAGSFVTRFEELFAEFCEAPHAVAVSNGTTALHLALAALGVGRGDEVIVPTLTFVATANAVAYTGATPVFVDSEPGTWNIDPAEVAAAITARTKAILPVHLYGHPADLDAILGAADERGIPVLEDAAEAHGARYRGRRVGAIGAAGTFSFYGNKTITTGEGGMVVTRDGDLAERMRVLRDHGTTPGRRYHHERIGFNYRLTNLQAAVGVAQMEKVEEILAAKRRIAERYRRGLEGVAGLTLPPEAPWAENVHWLFTLLVDEQAFGRSRDDLLARLAGEGVETRPVFPPVHRQPAYATGQELPVAESLAAAGLSLPSAVTLSDDDVDRVVESLRASACIS